MEQLTRTQYTILYRYARIERRRRWELPASKQSVADTMTQIGALHKVTPFPRGCMPGVMAHLTQQPIDRLARKQDKSLARNADPDLYRAAYRLGQAYERAISHAHDTRLPDDFNPAIEAEKTFMRLVTEHREVYLYWDYVNGRNSIRNARHIETLNH